MVDPRGEQGRAGFGSGRLETRPPIPPEGGPGVPYLPAR